jgi:diguanylate cyclase (GGDEF)-like protein
MKFMTPIIPKPTAALAESYQSYCVKNNLTLVGYFSVLAIVVFGLHLIHHLRLGMDIFSASMILYTLLYSFNIIYALVNIVVLPKMRDVTALQALTILLEMAYPFFMALVFTILGVVGVTQEGGPVPFVVGMLVISVMLQGHYLALLILLASCWSLFSLGVFYNVPLEKATSPIMICFTVVLASAAIARLTEKSRIELFLAIEELRKKNQLLTEMSDIDPLTGICNRKHFSKLLGREVARASRYNHPMGLLLISVDDFQQLNETLGDAAGDQILLDVAKLIKPQQREIDVVCRFNDDEFVVMLLETNIAQSMEVAQRIHAIIESHDFSHNDQNITVSIGHTQYAGQPANKFIENAQKMLLESKRLGKNCVSSDSV